MEEQGRREKEEEGVSESSKEKKLQDNHTPHPC